MSRHAPADYRDQPLPSDPEAEQAFIGSVLFGGWDDRFDPAQLFDEGRRYLAIAAEFLRANGPWSNPKSDSAGDRLTAARTNAARVAQAVRQAESWPIESVEPDCELQSCLDACGMQSEAVSHYLDRIIAAHYRRTAIEDLETRLRSVYSGDLEAGVEGTPLASLLNGHGWLEPATLPDDLPGIEPFDSSLLPESLRPWIEDISERIQCPPDFPAVAAMIVAAGLVGRKVGIRPKCKDDWLVVPNLWGAVIGRPGLMKTPAITEPLNVLKRLEIGAKDDFLALQSAHAAAKLVGEIQQEQGKKAIRDALKTGGDAQAVAASLLSSQSAAPVRRRYLVNDATVEKLGETLNENPNGVVVFRDEITGLLLSLDREGQEGARSFYLEAWNGTNRYTFDRIGRGTIDIESTTVSIIGGIQPGPLMHYFKTATRGGAGDDGLIQRFQLAVWPDSPHDWRNVDRWPDTTAKQAAFDAYSMLHTLDARLIGTQVEDDSIPFLRFAPDAQEQFTAWRTILEGRLRGSEESPAMESHLAKYRSLIPSLALLIHLTDEPHGAVRLDALDRAIRWGTYLESHARRLYFPFVRGDVPAARSLAKRIKEGVLPSGFTLRDVYRAGWSGLSERDEAQAAVDLLIDLNWLRPLELKTGGRPQTVYRINPKLKPNRPAAN